MQVAARPCANRREHRLLIRLEAPHDHLGPAAGPQCLDRLQRTGWRQAKVHERDVDALARSDVGDLVGRGSLDHVEVQTGDGTTIVADRASAINHGQELTFEGHVRTNIVPQTNQEPASEVKRIDQ